jgi:hypothetical protein
MLAFALLAFVPAVLLVVVIAALLPWSAAPIA